MPLISSIMSLLAAALGAVGNIAGQLGSTIISSATSRHSQKEANKRNAELNERNIQNEWDMWNATNAYNSPAAQAMRYEEAGLNPLLVGSEAGLANLASAPSSIPNQSIGGLDFGAMSFANDLKALAEAQKIQTETKSTEADVQSKMTYNRFYSQLLAGQINLQNVEIRNAQADVKVKVATAKELWAKLPIWESTVSQIQEQSALFREQRFNILFEQNMRRAEFDWKKRYDSEEFNVMRATARNLISSSVHSDALSRLTNSQTYYQRKVNKYADYNLNQQSLLLRWNNANSKLLFELNDRFGPSERRVKMATEVLNGLSNATNAASNAYSAGKTGTSFYNQGVQKMQSAGSSTSNTFEPSQPIVYE